MQKIKLWQEEGEYKRGKSLSLRFPLPDTVAHIGRVSTTEPEMSVQKAVGGPSCGHMLIDRLHVCVSATMLSSHYTTGRLS